MEVPIPSKVKRAWESWNIQVFILVSLFLQVILVLLAPFRKKTSNKFFNIMIWSAYMSADWAATFVVGLVGNYNSGDDSPGSEDPRFDLLAFWAPFLLLHLSGPDTITAFSLEDNELWLRILFGFVFQLIASAYILFLSLPKNRLLIPTVLMLLVGSARCAERVYALFYARLDNFREPLLPKTGGLGESSHNIVSEATNDDDDDGSRVQDDKKGNDPEKNADSMSYLEVIQHAFRFFEDFKGLVVDQTFSNHIRDKSRKFFLSITPEDAFNMVQAELDFFYGALYTKAPAVASKKGYLLRFVSISSLVASLVIFIFLDKQPLRRVDVRITYTLLIGSMALDVISLLMLVSSDWATADLAKNNTSCSFLKPFYRVNKRSWFDGKDGLPKQIISRRWSESVPQLNLLRYVENQRSGNVMYRVSNCLGLGGDFLDELQHVSTQPITDNNILKNLIFDEIQVRAKKANDLASVDDIISSKSWLREEFPYADESIRQILDKVEDFDETVLIWHMATTLLYLLGHLTEDDKEYRQKAMVLSDYMLYLLLMQPTLMFPVAGIAKKRFRDTCLHAHRLFLTMSLADYSIPREETSSRVNLYKFVRRHLYGVTPLEQGDKSVLFTVFSLTELLDGWFFIGGYKNKWERLSKIWIDLLFYAAYRSKGYSHAQQLCNGGQLISLVWLLMTHFGLSQQFE